MCVCIYVCIMANDINGLVSHQTYNVIMRDNGRKRKKEKDIILLELWYQRGVGVGRHITNISFDLYLSVNIAIFHYSCNKPDGEAISNNLIDKKSNDYIYTWGQSGNRFLIIS